MNEIIIINPLTDRIKDSLKSNTQRLNFAFPFLSAFALKILNEQNTSNISDKRIITRFDDTNLNSFDLPTLKRLLDLGFEIKFNNKIHLKLYIFDKEIFITSSNFTKGGFENNIELSVMIDSANSQTCVDIFNELWLDSVNNNITYEKIENNWGKYKLLRKREKYANKTHEDVEIEEFEIGEIKIEQLIQTIFNQKTDYSQLLNYVFESNKLKKRTIGRINKGFNKDIFYVEKGHPKRRDNMFYELVYGPESKYAGTGLREMQFQTVFEDSDFINVITYLIPETVGIKPWNLSDKKELIEFCNGLFDFDIPQYVETLPIRLASYFYPEYFLSIFKLEDLEKVCDAFGLKTNATSKGDRLYAYNSCILEKMKILPFNNAIKSDISYKILYTVELYKRLNEGNTYDIILTDYKQNWKKELIEYGRKLLLQLGTIN